MTKKTRSANASVGVGASFAMPPNSSALAIICLQSEGEMLTIRSESPS